MNRELVRGKSCVPSERIRSNDLLVLCHCGRVRPMRLDCGSPPVEASEGSSTVGWSTTSLIVTVLVILAVVAGMLARARP